MKLGDLACPAKALLEMSLPYLDLGIEEPDAALRAKRWRVQCRRARQACLIAMRSGSTFALEVRPAPNSLAQLDPDMLACHPDYEFMRSGSYSGGRRSFLFEGMPVARLERIVAVASDLLETCACEEMRSALRRGEDPIAPPADSDSFRHTFGATIYSHEIASPNLRLELCEPEYKCWQDCLSQLFDALPKPLPLVAYTLAEAEFWFLSQARLDARFQDLCPQVHEQWRAGLVGYEVQPRFQPGLVEIGQEGIRLSRPGFSQDGNEAVFWLQGPLLSGPFQGLVRAQKDQQWRVIELSYDDDWEELPFEPRQERDWKAWDRPVPQWRWAWAEYAVPDREDTFYSSQQWEECEREFAELAAGNDSRRVIPMVQGPALSVQEVRQLGLQRGEILWSHESSKTSESLLRIGYPVVRWGQPGDPQWLGKLLYHLDQTIPCRRLESTWVAEPGQDAADAHRQSILKLLEAVFRRAGCAPLRCRHWGDERHTFGWQSDKGGLVRICGSPGLFDQPGTLWVHIGRHGFRNGVFELLGTLCRWGDPDSRWTRNLWRAAQIESAWSGLPSADF